MLRFEDGKVTDWCIGAKPVYLMEKELRLTKRGAGELSDSDMSFLDRLFGRR